MSEIRDCSRDDIPAVAALFQRTFRRGDAAHPASLEAAIASVHFDHPWFDPEISPRVHVNDAGRVTGFIGVFPGRFTFRGRDLRAAIAGSLMVEDPEREPTAGARLVRSVAKGPQDISISETSNAVSQGLWRRVGGTIVAPLSLDWFRIFRPGRAALAMAAEKVPQAALLASVAAAGDAVTGRWTSRAFELPPPGSATIDSDPSDEAVLDALLDLASTADLAPRWTRQDLQWLLQQAAGKSRYGPLHRGLVRDRNGRLAGCYLYHGEAGGIGRVLNVVGRADALGEVAACLMRDAASRKLAALRGRSDPRLLGAFLPLRCVFAHRGAMAVQANDTELVQAMENGSALVIGLAGESWSPLIGHDFR